MTMIDGVPAEWTASRITRLLRPLKAKCLALSTYMKETSVSSITTYGGRRVPGDDELLPLEVPSNIGLRIHFSRNTVQTLDLSKRIYAIRDCYCDLLSKDRSVIDESPSPPTLSPLTSLCSVILGAQIPCENGLPDRDATSNTEEALYQAIPPSYRLRTLIMHALHIILESSPPNASLYLSLLEVTSERQLYHESEVLLEATLEYAFEPSQSKAPRITNPAYRRFLVDLYSNWNKQFPPSIFVRLVVGALQRAPADIVWTSKAIRRLARKLGRYDPCRLAPLLAGLMDAVSTRKKILKPTRHLEAQLQEWFHFCAETCMSSMWGASDGLVSPLNQDLLDSIIEYYLSWIIQWGVESPNSFMFGDAGACLYTLWLTSGSREIRPDDVLRCHFQHYIPSSSTFTPICNHIFRTKSLNECEDILLTFSRMVLHHNLPRLNASLWACALYHTEEAEIEQIHMDRNGREAVRDFRLRLVEYVDEAENGCFAATPHSGTFLERDSVLDVSTPAWSWEASVGCWFRRNVGSQDDVPATPKRRKKARHSYPLSDMFSPSTTLFRRSSTQIARNSDTKDVSPCSPEQAHGAFDESTCTHSNDARPTPDSFFSILSNALSSRASLSTLRDEHEEPLRKNHGDETAPPAFEDLEQGDDTSDTDDDDDGCRCTDHALSEDYLDLFRIAGTSPLQVK